MLPLPELQRATLDALYGREGTAARYVRPNGLQPQRRLAIYRNNLFDSLGAALAAVYPTIEQLVGAVFFGHVARAYIPAHPPRTGNLHDFGEDFPAFLAAFEPARELPYLADCARLDWAWHAVFHCEPLPASDPRAVLARTAALPAEQRAGLVLRWQPAAALVASPYPILRIWRMHHQADAPSTLDLDAGPEQVLVATGGGEVLLHGLQAGEHALLAALARGAALGDAVAAGLAVDAALDAAGLIARHLALGTLLGPEQAP